MRLIDADALKEVMVDTLKAIIMNPKMDIQEAHIISAFHTVGLMIDDSPTVDAVEVVRCKDCNHCDGMSKGCLRNPCLEEWKQDDFCSYGVREWE